LIIIALGNRRLTGYGGICKEKHKELNRRSHDDLIRAGDGTVVASVNYELERYRWDVKARNYIRIIDEVDNEF